MTRNVTQKRSVNRNAIIKNYAGIVEPRKVAVVLARAKKLGLPEHLFEDITQRMSLDVLEFKYDSKKSNGASEITAIAAVAKHKVIDMLRRMEFEKVFWERQTQTVVLERDEIKPLQMKMDILSAFTVLPPVEQEICLKLAAGQTINSITHAQGWKWEKTHQVVLGIRKRFTDLGLRDYLGEK